MDRWQIHIPIALLVIFILSLVDIYQRRIPNKILLAAVVVHIALSLFSSSSFNNSFNNQGVMIAIILLFIFLIFFERSSQWVFERIGMGDIKLLLYLIWIFTGVISWRIWLMALSAISLLFIGWMIVRRKRLDHQIAFAPFASSATLISLLLFSE
jgi:Flp pilus assembly protein protease CpaA